jgi:ribulose-phosphate 3-epimerase
MKMKVAPSVLTADFTHLSDELKSIETADFIHLDIMDGHFVPNISFGPAISKSISQMTDVLLDVHLMVTDPMNWIDGFTFKNTKYITIHTEANDVLETIKKIKSNNIGVGLSVKPNTPVDDLMPYLKDASLVLVMTVEPGFGGQSFMVDMMEKVKKLVEIRKTKGFNFLIEVDGGINDKTIDIAKSSGVDIVVAGSYLFNLKDRKKGIESLR